MAKGKTRLGDVIWGAVIVIWIAALIIPSTRAPYMAFTGMHKYLGGFLSFAILATMGDLLAGRIGSGHWKVNGVTFIKALIWGFIGMAITLFFGIMSSGVTDMQKAGLLPFAGSLFGHAFFTAALTNLSFGPAMFIFHKFTDAFIEARMNGLPSGLGDLVERIDWKTFFRFSVATTIPCFWIPAHTVDFMLPADLRVLVAAFLSIMLGLLLSLSKKLKKDA